MKKTLTAEEIIEQHIKYDEIIDKANITGDYKLNNKTFKKRDKLILILKDDLTQAKAVYAFLLEYDNVTTKTSAAAICLKLDIYVDKAEQILEEISARDDIGIRRFDAEMVLRVWRGESPGKKL